MIKLQLKFDGKSSQEFEIVKGESLEDAVFRACKDLPLGHHFPANVFNVTVNGMCAPSDRWSKITTLETDTIVITPKIMDGEAGQIFGQVIIAAVTIYVGTLTGGMSLLAQAAITAAASIGTTLLMNELIPPPVQDVGNETTGGVEKSQMYAVTGQSNQVKKLGYVPKVYGTHRVFPLIAANPYTELSVDPETGETIQYLCAIYDFGLGTPQISDLKIGETPLNTESFNDFQVRFVDPNLPDSKDVFDNNLFKDFIYYKGDKQNTQLAIALADGEENIQVSYPNTRSLSQDIQLDLVAPRGLFGSNSSGGTNERTVELEVSFAKVGSTDWRPYNHPDYVSKYSSIGGIEGTDFQTTIAYLSRDNSHYDRYYYQTQWYRTTHGGWLHSAFLRDQRKMLFRKPEYHNSLIIYGSQTLLDENVRFTIGSRVVLQGRFMGTVAAINEPPPPAVDPITGLPIEIDLRTEYLEITLDRDIVDIVECMRQRTSRTYIHGGMFAELFYVEGWGLFDIQSKEMGIVNVSGNSTYPVYASINFSPIEQGQYQVRVRRVETRGDYISQKADDLTWVSIITSLDQNPIQTDKRHVFMELKIRATDQLNGNIQNLSAICSQPIPVFDPSTLRWDRQVTSNPAWVFCDLLTGEVNKRPVALNRLEMNSILAWANYCDEIPTPPPGHTYLDPRFSCNFVLDYETTLQEILGQVGGAAQASLNIIDGKYGVLVDRFKTTPVQIFTPRNSRDFSSNRVFSTRPQGLKIKYIDPNKAWEVSEVIAYDDGFNEDNSTEFEEMTSFACTSVEQAWRFGRLNIAKNKLRQETMSLTVDFEWIRCTRGDFVKITQDVMKVGGVPARVIDVNGTEVTVDSPIDIIAGVTDSYEARLSNGTIVVDQMTPISSTVFDLQGVIPQVGDLIVIGERDKVTFDCLVKSINPNDDLSATITLIERANDIFAYESEGYIPEYDPQISQTSDPDRYPPSPVTDLSLLQNTYECAMTQSGYNYFAEFSWNIPSGSVYEFFEIWVNDGRGYTRFDTTTDKRYKYNIDQGRLDMPHGVKVVAVSTSGRKIGLVEMPELVFIPETKSAPPADVLDFGMSITNQTLQLSWSPVLECDINKYEIRFSPDTNDVWDASVPLQIVDRNVNSLAVQARTGIYFIKAVDFAGNKSVNATKTLTTIPNLFELNIIETINDAPDFNGQFDKTELMGEAIVLQKEILGDVNSMKFFSEGTYEISKLLDLGDIYSVRLQSLIRADGYKFNELMSEWEHLSDVDHLNTADSDDWNVIAEYRATNEILAMADWEHLYDVEHINEGLGQGFTDWRPIPTTGDATGRVFQFRIKLQSLTPNVTPRLFDATIKADMPDRIDSFDNLVSSATELTRVDYARSFRGPGTTPVIQISIDNGQSGDYWTFEDKTLDGFGIRFYDESGTQVSRQFDVVAKGYGRRNPETI